MQERKWCISCRTLWNSFFNSLHQRQTFATDNSNTVTDMKTVVISVYVNYDRASVCTCAHKSLNIKLDIVYFHFCRMAPRHHLSWPGERFQLLIGKCHHRWNPHPNVCPSNREIYSHLTYSVSEPAAHRTGEGSEEATVVSAYCWELIVEMISTNWSMQCFILSSLLIWDAPRTWSEGLELWSSLSRGDLKQWIRFPSKGRLFLHFCRQVSVSDVGVFTAQVLSVTSSVSGNSASYWVVEHFPSPVLEIWLCFTCPVC